MGASRESLLHAAAKYGREDRVTEVFATVLGLCDELAAALFAEVGLPSGTSFRVSTQVTVTLGERPDMVIESFDRSGTVVSRIWSEHKVGAGFSRMQRERYAQALHALPGEHNALILIVADAPTAREEGGWHGLTWQEIAELAELAGRAWGAQHGDERDWRKHALRPGAPAKWRLVWELLWCLEVEEGLAVAQALDGDNVLAFKLMERTASAVYALLERASQHAAPLVPAGDIDGEFPESVWQHFETPPGSWLERFADVDGAAELVIADRDYWSPSELNEPALAAGFSLPKSMHAQLSAQRDWVHQLDATGFCCGVWDSYTCIYKTLPMQDILAFGDTLREQAESVGRWASDTIAKLNELDPGELPVVPQVGPGRGSRRRSR